MPEKRTNIPKQIQLKVWNRDNWTCRYCGKPVFFAPALKLLDKKSPNHGYYHPNGKEENMLPLFQRGWASVDHVEPKSKGGEDSMDNYVTACWGCNLKWGQKTHSEGKHKPNELNKSKVDWDGFSSLYLRLSDHEDVWTKLLKKEIK
jgi:5-methylcytosine-specific restriction endonuclease McrA